LGESLLALGNAGDAVGPLERALAIRGEEREPDQARLADTAFALAQALWEGGGDRVRAQRLAVEAHALDKALDRATEVQAIEAWLAARSDSLARPR
jgi:hypothetical protein